MFYRAGGPSSGPQTGHWSWADTLALARPGESYRVTAILFSCVREQCHGVGLHEGTELVCVENHDHAVTLVPAHRRTARIAREDAWFVGVERLCG